MDSSFFYDDPSGFSNRTKALPEDVHSSASQKMKKRVEKGSDVGYNGFKW